MDILEPELIWVDGRCYRFYERTAWNNIHTSAPYTEDMELNCSNDESETDIEIITSDSGFSHSFYVPKVFYARIIGAKNASRKKLENDTKTTIYIPKRGEDGNIVIYGNERKGIISARNRLDLQIETLKEMKQFTHFLSIPLNKKDIIDKFNCFKNNVLEKYGKTAYNIDNSIFQTPEKLHITIGMLKLFDDDDEQHAVEALTGCRDYVIRPILEETGPINIKLQGVAIMNDDPSDVAVLYAQIAESEKLQELVNKVAEYFNDIGLIQQKDDNVKLHITFMNTTFKKNFPGKYKKRYDASEILKEYKDTSFGETIFNQIDISILGSAPPNDYYQSLGSITF